MGWRGAPGASVVYQGICWYPYLRAYTTLTSFLNFILPLLITSGIYIQIYLITRERNKTLVHGQLASVEENNISLGNLNATKTISLFVGVFFCCWVSYSMYIIIISLCDSCLYFIPPVEAFVVLLMFGYFNSGLNPFLFALRNKNFKFTNSRLFSSALFETRPTLGTRGGSTLTQLAFTSEIPDSTDSNVRLQWISVPQDETLR